MGMLGPQRVPAGKHGHVNGPKSFKVRDGEPLEIDRRGCQIGLVLHVVETATERAPKAVPSLRLAVEALRTPEVTLVQSPIILAPLRTSAPCL